MKFSISLLFLFAVLAAQPDLAYPDTPPPGTVKAKMYSGDGATAITATGTALNVNVTNTTPPSTVDQGAGGSDPWLVHALAWPLPTGAAVSSKQPSLGAAGFPSTDVLTIQGVTGMTPLKTDGSGFTQPVSGTFWQATQPVSGSFWQATQPVSGTFWQASQPVTGTFWQTTQPVSAASLPLPTGASTSAAQTTANTSLSLISTNTSNIPAQGQALSAGSMPVVLPAAQITTLTPPTTVTVTQGTAANLNATVTGTVTANAGTGTFTVDASGHTVPVTGTFWQATQPVSAAALPLPSGASTAAKQPALGTAGTPSSDVLTVQGATSMTALKVDGSAVTQPVSAASLPLPTGAATAALQTTGNTSLSSIDTKTPALGQALAASSVPVVLTSAQITTLTPPTTVTANIGTTNGLALDASVTGLQVAQSSTTSGQNGTVVQGAVTTAAPTYTTAKSNPLSLTTAGALRVDGSAVTQPASLSTLPALTAGSALIGKVGIDQTTPGTTNLVALAANQSVNLAQVAGATTSTGNGVAGTGVQRVTIASDNTAFSVNAKPVVPAAVTVKQAALTIGTSAVRLTNDALVPPSTRVLLVAQLLSTSTANCYFGSSSVTSSSTGRGVQMLAGQTFSFSNDAGDYYAICDTATQTIFVTEQE